MPARLLVVVTLLAAAAVPPAPSRFVTDGAGFLSPQTRDALEGKLEAYERTSGHQVVVWIAKTTGGEPIEDFAVRAFEKWGVGRKGKDDGAVLFVMADDRRARIEVGYGLEDKLPDAIAFRIVTGQLTPRLKEGKNDEGVTAAVDAMLATIEGKPVGTQAPLQPVGWAPPKAQLWFYGLMAIAFLFLFITRPALALQLLFFMGRGGLGGGSGHGRRGFSGGGGRSGGGGASGSW